MAAQHGQRQANAAVPAGEWGQGGRGGPAGVDCSEGAEEGVPVERAAAVQVGPAGGSDSATDCARRPVRRGICAAVVGESREGLFPLDLSDPIYLAMIFSFTRLLLTEQRSE